MGATGEGGGAGYGMVTDDASGQELRTATRLDWLMSVGATGHDGTGNRRGVYLADGRRVFVVGGPEQLAEYDRRRLTRAMDKMPYSSGIHLRFTDGVQTVDDLIAWLTGMQEVLRQVAEDNEARSNELQRLRRLIAGGRELLGELLGGTSPASPTADNREKS